jgi:hypothetical protein
VKISIVSETSHEEARENIAPDFIGVIRLGLQGGDTCKGAEDSRPMSMALLVSIIAPRVFLADLPLTTT